MAEILIVPSNHSGKSNDDFVGMKFVSIDGEPSVSAIFPLGYNYTALGKQDEYKTKENQAKLKKELYLLLNTIKKHSKNIGGKLEGTDNRISEFPFDAYITVIKAFMQRGYYIENEIKYKNAPIGKINWKRTIAKVKPMIQHGSPIYTDFVIRHSEKKTDKLISLIHEWCVYEAFIKLGWIFTTFNPRKPTLKIDDDNKKFYVSVIHDSLKGTFNDRNKQLFYAMLAMLNERRAEERSTFFFGTTHFNTVWESLIDEAYGIPKSEKRLYFPPVEWNFVFSEKPMVSNLYPDTIMHFNGDEVFVLDAKYYSFILNPTNVPAAADVNKQVTYGAYASGNPQKKTVYNAFLIPYDFEHDPHGLKTKGQECFYIGYAKMVDSKTDMSHDRVLGILIDTKNIMQNAGKPNKANLAEFIREKRKQADNV